MARALGWVMAACLMSVLGLGAATAQSPEVGSASPPTPAVEPRPQGPLGVDVPRGAVEQFLTACRENDYARAAELLDLRKIPRAARATRGPLLARELEAVLERSVALDLALLSDATEGEPEDGLPASRDLLAIVETEGGPVELQLQRISVGGSPVWQVTAETVARIPALYAELGYGLFADRLPAPLVTLRFLGVRLWQWLGLLVVIGVALSVAWLATFPAFDLRNAVVTWSFFPVSALAIAAKDRRVVAACLVWLIALYPLSAVWHAG